MEPYLYAAVGWECNGVRKFLPQDSLTETRILTMN